MSLERLLWENDATALAGLVGSGEVQPRELVDAAIARAERVNPHINAIAEPLFERARKAAGALVAGPFSGVPTAIKDIDNVLAGVPIHTGSRVRAVVPDRDMAPVARMIEAGLVPIATSTRPEQGLRLMTESAAFGITRNPWNTAHTSGGSSGGAASLVAAGVVPVAHASDGGGSIRVPAAATGLVGMKPSRGRVPLAPTPADVWFGMIVHNALTRSVRDSAALLDCLSRADPAASYVAPAAGGSFAAAAHREPGKLRIGVYRKSPLGLAISPETQAAIDAGVALAIEAGHAVEEVDLPGADRALLADFCRLVATAMAARMRAERVRLGRSALAELERGTRVIARYGEAISAGAVGFAHERVQLASRRIIEATMHYDAVLMPVIAHPPLAVGAMDAKGADEMVENMLDRLRLTGLLRVEQLFGQLMDKSLWFTHWPAIQNMTGQPAIALPVHVTAEGLPLGIQAVGRPGGEEALYALAGQMERQSGWLDRRAPFHVPD
jgi:amidase